MQFTTSLISFIVIALVTVQGQATALPEKRSAAAEFCTNNNLQGSCVNIFPANNQCVSFGSDFNDKVSSIHVQPGTTCRLFKDTGCSGQSLFIGSDVAALGDFNFNDVTSSFTCTA